MAVAAAVLFAGSATLCAATVTAAQAQLYADRINLEALSGQYSSTRFIVTYHEQSAERAQAASRQLDFQRVTSLTGASVRSVRTLATGAELVEVSGNTQRQTRQDDFARDVMVAFAQNPNVAYVEPDRVMHALFTPNDTYFANQWDLTDATGGMRMPAAWDLAGSAPGAGINVAVLDTGITTHSDLSGQIVGGYDFISDSAAARDGNGRDSNAADQGDWYAANECGAGYPASNSSWHGTHVTGTIVAAANNAKGIAGVAYGAKVVPVRVLGKCGGSVSDIVDAIVWASGGSVSGVPANTNPARVLNLSLGGGGACGSFQSAINTARSNGAIFVVAAGNENQNVSNSSPANCSNVVSVAATTKSGARASYSNYGSTIVVSAPGGDGSGGAGDILSTLNSGTTTPASENYAYYAGTSMATPHVAALAALVFQKNPSLTPDQVKNILTSTARPLPGACSGGCGAGIVDAQAALQAAGGGSSNTAPVANFSFTTSGLSANFTDSSSDSDGTIASRSWNFGDGGSSTATNPSHTYAAAGTYSVSLTVTDNGGASNTKTSSVTVSSGGGGSTVLQNGVAVTGLSAVKNGQLRFTMVVPAGATNLKFVTSGGSGDGDLYVKFGSAPTTSSYDCRSWNSGNSETCSITTAQAGTYHVMINAYAAFSGMSLTGSYSTGGGGGGTVLQNGVAVTGLSAVKDGQLRYTMVVPAGATNLKFVTSGGSGDGDLYVKFGSAPTTSSYDCRSWNSGNGETCSITTAQAGTYHVMINAYAAFSGMSLTGSYSTGGGGGGTTMSNGVPVTGLAATSGNWTADYTLVVPAGATNLKFAMSGGSGDADLYVRLNAAPTTSSYSCRPYLTGNTESCSWAAPTAGTWHVSVRAYSTFSGVTVTPSYTP
ncbi:MAG: S8 family serine peptidase [Rhodanobacteraceae bacterium]|nr:S8 family serine peptidase [Rhodanobacteraceae bacterium]